MASRSQRIRLGLFLAVSGTAMLATVGVLSGRAFLEDRHHYYVRYTDASVRGLELGADVRYQGVRVGRVEHIAIDPADLTTVVVELSLSPDTPVRTDTRAVLVFEGITGLKSIELRAGSPSSPPLPPGGEIPAGPSLTDDASEAAFRIARELEDVLARLNELLGPRNQASVAGLLANLEASSDSLARAVGELSALAAAGEALLSQTRAVFLGAAAESLMARMVRLSGRADRMAGDLERAGIDSVVVATASALGEAERSFVHLDRILVEGREDLLRSLENLREGAEYLNEFSRVVAENPAILLRGGRADEIASPVEEGAP